MRVLPRPVMQMAREQYNCVVLLGPTAVGKTVLGVRIAAHYGWDIISADSRQVYRGLDIGSGKDLSEYTVRTPAPDGSVHEARVPYHLIDVATLDGEYNVFKFQSDFYALFRDMRRTAFVVGGTGMYVDSVIRGYDFVPVPENPALRQELAGVPLEELGKRLLALKPDVHNKTDLLLRDRVVRALEIELFMRSEECHAMRQTMGRRPDIRALVIGTTLPRPELRQNIARRLRVRLDGGMIEEVAELHDGGYSWERLEKLGLEYRFVSRYLEGVIPTKEALYVQLKRAICQFAKRQETWFRGMQKKGVTIRWLPPVQDMDARYGAALQIIGEAGIAAPDGTGI